MIRLLRREVRDLNIWFDENKKMNLKNSILQVDQSSHCCADKIANPIDPLVAPNCLIGQWFNCSAYESRKFQIIERIILVTIIKDGANHSRSKSSGRIHTGSSVRSAKMKIVIPCKIVFRSKSVGARAQFWALSFDFASRKLIQLLKEYYPIRISAAMVKPMANGASKLLPTGQTAVVKTVWTNMAVSTISIKIA